MPMKLYGYIIFSLACTIHLTKPFSLMLDPAGDAKHTGRMLNDTFERSITLQCTEQLKKVIETELPHVRVILTRFPGESLETLQNANFANRLHVDLYVSIHCYKETETKPQMHLYYVSFNDDFLTKTYDLCLYPYTQAHLINNKKTKRCITQFKEV
ncbi:MAG: N-acetylmuramoyl-L-alanine amidase, partial [Kurthia sp.]|nr:N-acetylmuramoyl-L-alanine amidase [Kurthia sp.]